MCENGCTELQCIMDFWRSCRLLSVGGVWSSRAVGQSSEVLFPHPSYLPFSSSDHAKPAKGAKHTGAGEMLFQVLDLDNSGEITFKGEPGGGVGGAGGMLLQVQG